MKYGFPIKTLEDGRAMLNLACGIKMHEGWNNLDFSLYVRLAHNKTGSKFLRQTGFLSEERYQRLLGVDPTIILWDLKNGIPFPSESFDVVYHSHLLEHLDRESAPLFLKECYRVLKKGGITRVVVPDLQNIVNRYISSISKLKNGDESALDEHEQVIHDLFDQMVRKEPAGTKQQNPLVRIIELLLRGDAIKAGEVHRWMYDKYTLASLLKGIGFKSVQEMSSSTSQMKGWSQFKLDINDDNTVFQPGSLYMEGVK